MNKFFLASIMSLSCIGLFAQTPQHVCGVSYQDGEQIINRMIRNRLQAANIPVQERGAITYIPIHFHLAASSLSVGRAKEWAALDQLCDLNEAYSPTEIQFYLSPHPTLGLFDKTINHDGVYTTQTNTFLMSTKRHANAINVYVANEAASGNNQPGTTLAYYSPSFDWIVSRKDQINGTGNGTLPHEVGHFFSLPHTFFGWESGSFTSASAGWPKAPAISPGGASTERQNGSNCTTAADRICDTPPDYNFGFVQGNCNPYNGGAQDPLGELVNPMENNFMSYFSNCSNYQFTAGQVTEMKQDIAAADRNYLDNSFSPTTTTLTVPTDFMLEPTQNSTTATYDRVTFKWATVPEATYYLFEVDIAPSFISTKLQTQLMTGSASTTTTVTLEANRTYYWRVRPFNVYTTCGTFPNRSFKTSTTSALSDLPQIMSAEVAPNPITGSDLNLLINAAESFEMQLSLTDATGRVLIQENSVQVSAGEQSLPINVESLPNGAYFLTLRTGGRTESKLVTVVR